MPSTEASRFMSRVIDVAAGALRNAQGEILLAQRPAGKHMAGFWEFPGGKFEPGETAWQALVRELSEELGVDVQGGFPLITLVHEYSDRTIRLHVWEVNDWFGEPQSLDQQALEWVKPESMPSWDLLPADKPIVTALQLPNRYAISPDFSKAEWPVIECWLQGLVEKKVTLFQWRQSAASADVAKQVAEWAKKNGLVALLNGVYDSSVFDLAAEYGYSGVHLKSTGFCEDAKNIKASAKSLGLRWLAGSCHSDEELGMAKELGFDFAVLGPLQQTQSHASAAPIGWEQFRSWATEAGLPVYALGGCSETDIDLAHENGAQGIAGISTFL